jgi:repressor LexA
MPRNRDLSPRRREILEYIRQTIADRGYPPTVREIGKGVGLKSTSTVHFHLKALEDGQFLEREKLLTRAMRPGPAAGEAKQRPARFVPLVGRVAAGLPILAEQNIDEIVPLPEEFLPGGEAFLLRVRGDSMIGDGINDGDLVVVHRQEAADTGDIVVAMVEDEATVKRFVLHPDRVELRPANDKYQPIFAQDVHVLGKVVGLLRRF